MKRVMGVSALALRKHSCNSVSDVTNGALKIVVGLGLVARVTILNFLDFSKLYL